MHYINTLEMFNKNSQGDRQPWHLDQTDHQHEIPIDQQYSFFQQLQMPMYNPQFIWGQQMPNFQFPQHQYEPNLVPQIENNSKIKSIQKSRKKFQEYAQNAKSNLKNTYINKIQGLMKESDVENQQEIKDPVQLSLSKDISSQHYRYIIEEKIIRYTTKLERNRECAKNSRKRKKIYIELLETKMQSIEDELLVVKQEAKERQQQYDNQADFYTQPIKNIVKHIDELPEDIDHQSIKDLEIKEIMKLLYQQMININFPNHLIYLFNVYNQKKIDNQIERDFFELELDQDQVDKINGCLGQMNQSKQVLDGLIISMSNVMNELFNEYMKVQGIIQSGLKTPLGEKLEHLSDFLQKNEDIYSFESVFQTIVARK